MNIMKFIFNRNYRKNIIKIFSAEIVIKNYNVDKEMEFIYANINVRSKKLAA